MYPAGMFLSRFTVPLGSRFRLFPSAELSNVSSDHPLTSDASAPTATAAESFASRLKHLRPLNVMRQLQAPGGGGAGSDAESRLELDFADYMDALTRGGTQQRCDVNRRRSSHYCIGLTRTHAHTRQCDNYNPR